MIAVIVYSMLLTAAMMIIAHRLTRVMQENKRAEAELRAVGAHLRETSSANRVASLLLALDQIDNPERSTAIDTEAGISSAEEVHSFDRYPTESKIAISVISRNVRFGSKADICGAKWHVRFTPKSGQVQCKTSCPLCANSGH